MESQLCLSCVVPAEPHFLHLHNGMSRHRGNSRFAQPGARCTEALPECSGNTSSYQGLLRPLCCRLCAVQAGDSLRSLHPLLLVLPAVWLVADTHAVSAHVLLPPHSSAPHSSGSQLTSAGPVEAEQEGGLVSAPWGATCGGPGTQAWTRWAQRQLMTARGMAQLLWPLQGVSSGHGPAPKRELHPTARRSLPGDAAGMPGDAAQVLPSQPGCRGHKAWPAHGLDKMGLTWWTVSSLPTKPDDSGSGGEAGLAGHREGDSESGYKVP